MVLEEVILNHAHHVLRILLLRLIGGDRWVRLQIVGQAGHALRHNARLLGHEGVGAVLVQVLGAAADLAHLVEVESVVDSVLRLSVFGRVFEAVDAALGVLIDLRVVVRRRRLGNAGLITASQKHRPAFNLAKI